MQNELCSLLFLIDQKIYLVFIIIKNHHQMTGSDKNFHHVHLSISAKFMEKYSTLVSVHRAAVMKYNRTGSF